MSEPRHCRYCGRFAARGEPFRFMIACTELEVRIVCCRCNEHGLEITFPQSKRVTELAVTDGGKGE